MTVERLKELQQTLIDRGVRDVKFFFLPNALGTFSQNVAGATVVLEAYVAGRCTVAERYSTPPTQ